jgi:hypothetical protein
MIHRLPVSDVIRPHVNSILILTLNLIKEDNEENVLICLRIIIDLHKQYRPSFYPQVSFDTLAIVYRQLIRFVPVSDQGFSHLHSNYLLQFAQQHGQNFRPENH